MIFPLILKIIGIVENRELKQVVQDIVIDPYFDPIMWRKVKSDLKGRVKYPNSLIGFGLAPLHA